VGSARSASPPHQVKTKATRPASGRLRMRKPRPVNSPRDFRRFRSWINEFGAYRHAVTQLTIENWLKQFKPRDRDLAARLLDSVDFYAGQRIAASLRNALGSIEGWHANPARRTGRWRFVSFSGSAGKSGDAMLHQFRLANNLDGRQSDEMFVYRSDLIRERLTSDDTVVLVDDLTATGTQVCEVWEQHFAELVAGAGRTFLIVVLAGRGARKEIKNKTGLRLIPGHELREKDSLFSDECEHFTDEEKNRLRAYSRIANAALPAGFGDCGYLLVFQHRCPNNSVPLLHACNSKWSGLFPRND
jgi:hypothetical protein